MIKQHGFPYIPILVSVGFLSVIGIFTLAGATEQLGLVYGAIVAPILIVFGAFSYKVLTSNDYDKRDD